MNTGCYRATNQELSQPAAYGFEVDDENAQGSMRIETFNRQNCASVETSVLEALFYFPFIYYLFIYPFLFV